MTTVSERNSFFGDIYNPGAALSVFKKANHYFTNDELGKAQVLYKEISDLNENAVFNLGYIYTKENDLTSLRFLYNGTNKKEILNDFFSIFEEDTKSENIQKNVESNPLVSIIIPVHNSAIYLENCLETVLNQSYKNLEIIIINDGSTDNSPNIIKKFIEIDKRIKFIDLPIASGNPGTPKNKALEIAKGFYSIFIDSDDYISSDYIEKFVKEAIKSPKNDIVQSSGYHLDGADQKIIYKPNKDGINNFKHPLYHYHESVMSWDKLYRTNFLKEHNIKFSEIKAGGNIVFTTKAYIYANNIAVCADNYGYFYRRNNDQSPTAKINKENKGSVELQAFKLVNDWMNNSKLDNSIKDIINLKKIDTYLKVLKKSSSNINDLKNDLKNIEADKILNYFDALDDHQNKYAFKENFLNIPKKLELLNQPKISVIIPIHNVEEYLKQCLDSVVNQTLKDIEIILINDGSTDNTLNIIHEYLAKDNRIVLINNTQASGNSGTPRNQGIYKARGEYIAFVDSDDWIELNMFEKLYARGQQSQSDIVCSGGFYREDAEGNTKVEKIINSRFIPTKTERSKLFLSIHFPIVWYRIYKRDMILENNILFGEVKTSADLPFAFKSLLKANKVDKIEDIFYHYRFGRPGSTIERRQGTGAFEMYKSYANIVEYLKRHDLYNDYITYVIHKALGDYFYNSKFLEDHLKNDFKESFVNLINPHMDKIKDFSMFSENARKFLNTLKTFKNPNPSNLTTSEIKPAVSIIIPCHNVESYLSRCLDGILKQSLENIEIILINDGSTDNTLSVIKKYYAQDKRIKVINSNLASGNAGTPRNMGMCVAKGEYIGFVDADDWITPSMFAKLYEAAKNEDAEIASQTGFHRHDGKVADLQKINYHEISSPADREKAFESNYFSNIWNRIYKTDLIKGNGIYFPRIYLAEDMSFSFVAHAFAKKTKAVKGSWYYYNYNRKDSTTELRMGRKGFEILQSFHDVSKYFKSFKIYDQYASQLVYKKINSLWYTYDRMEKDLKDEFLTDMKALYKESLSPYIDKKLFTQNELKKLNLLES